MSHSSQLHSLEQKLAFVVQSPWCPALSIWFESIEKVTRSGRRASTVPGVSGWRSLGLAFPLPVPTMCLYQHVCCALGCRNLPYAHPHVGTGMGRVPLRLPWEARHGGCHSQRRGVLKPFFQARQVHLHSQVCHDLPVSRISPAAHPGPVCLAVRGPAPVGRCGPPLCSSPLPCCTVCTWSYCVAASGKQAGTNSHLHGTANREVPILPSLLSSLSCCRAVVSSKCRGVSLSLSLKLNLHFWKFFITRNKPLRYFPN